MECVLGKNGDELRKAAKAGRQEEVESLIRAGASVDLQDKYDGNTALIWASRNGHGSVADSLIRAGASVDIQDKYYGNTAIMWASSKGHGSVVDSLLEQHRFLYYNGVDPNPLRRFVAVEQSLESTSRSLCVTTLLADNYVYMDVDSTEELVQMLFAEYKQ